MTRKRTIITHIIASCLLVICLGLVKKNVYAQEGAEVPTKGEITLFDETSAVKNLHHQGNYLEGKLKEKSSFPSMGEFSKKEGLIIGLLLIIGVCLFYIQKRYRRNDR